MDRRQRLLMEGQFLWSVSNNDATFTTRIGPNPLTDTKDEDQFLMPANDHSSDLNFVDEASQAVQKFLTINPDEYVILHNPAAQHHLENPNGQFTKGKSNAMPALKVGEKRHIIAGSFPLWPTQWYERKKVHHLLSNPRLRQVRVRAVAVSAGFVAVLVGIICLIPAPLNTVCEGVIWIPEEAIVRAPARLGARIGTT